MTWGCDRSVAFGRCLSLRCIAVPVGHLAATFLALARGHMATARDPTLSSAVQRGLRVVESVITPSHADQAARFVTGSTMRHVVVLAGTGAIGMIAVFGVDLLNLFYISLLGQRAIAAAIGFAGV